MTGKELDYVRDTIENEGFDYAFVNYSDFKNIKDKKFHEYRTSYVAAHKQLFDYLGLED